MRTGLNVFLLPIVVDAYNPTHPFEANIHTQIIRHLSRYTLLLLSLRTGHNTPGEAGVALVGTTGCRVAARESSVDVLPLVGLEEGLRGRSEEGRREAAARDANRSISFKTITPYKHRTD
jgi:hypothetical protein